MILRLRTYYCDTGFGQKLAIRLECMGFKVYVSCLNIQDDQECDQGAKHLKVLCSKRLILIPLDVTWYGTKV